MFFFIVDFTTFTTFCLYRLLHEIFYSKQSFFIDLEQTGTSRVPYTVKHVDAIGAPNGNFSGKYLFGRRFEI